MAIMIEDKTFHPELITMLGTSRSPSSSQARHPGWRPTAHIGKKISLEEFPPFCLIHNDNNISYLISDYLLQVFRECGARPGYCLCLPALESLVRWFHVTEVDVKRAFLVLKTQGHDYQILGNRENIILWLNFTEA